MTRLCMEVPQGTHSLPHLVSPSGYHSECLSRKQVPHIRDICRKLSKFQGFMKHWKQKIKHCFSQVLHFCQTFGSVTFCWLCYSTFWKLIIYATLIFPEEKKNGTNNGRRDRTRGKMSHSGLRFLLCFQFSLGDHQPECFQYLLWSSPSSCLSRFLSLPQFSRIFGSPGLVADQFLWRPSFPHCSQRQLRP